MRLVPFDHSSPESIRQSAEAQRVTAAIALMGAARRFMAFFMLVFSLLFLSMASAFAQDGVWGFATPPYPVDKNCNANNAEIISVTPNPGQATGLCTSASDTVSLPVTITFSTNGNNVNDILIAYGFGNLDGSGTIYFDDCLAPNTGGPIPTGFSDDDGDSCLDGTNAAGTYSIVRDIAVKCDLDGDGFIDSGTAVDLWAAWDSNAVGTQFDVETPQCSGPTGGAVLNIAPKVTVSKTSVGATGSFSFAVSGAQNSNPFSITTTTENVPVQHPEDILPTRTAGNFNNLIQGTTSSL